MGKRDAKTGCIKSKSDENWNLIYREKRKNEDQQQEPVKVRTRETGTKRKTTLNACVISVFTSCNYGNLSAASQGQL